MIDGSSIGQLSYTRPDLGSNFSPWHPLSWLVLGRVVGGGLASSQGIACSAGLGSERLCGDPNICMCLGIQKPGQTKTPGHLPGAAALFPEVIPESEDHRRARIGRQK